MGQALVELCREVSINLGDLEESTLTSAASSSSLTDTARTEPDGHWAGHSLALVSGALAGEERAITAWDFDTKTFTTNAFSGTPAAGVSYELREKPRHTRAAIKTFINQAIREIQRHCWVPQDSRIALDDLTRYDCEVQEYAVPDDLLYVHKVLWQDISGATEVDDVADRPASPAEGDLIFQVDTGLTYEYDGSTWAETEKCPWYQVPNDKWTTHRTGTVLISYQDERYAIPDEAPLKFLGSVQPDTLDAEHDVSDVDGNFIAHYATSRMCYRLATGNDIDEYKGLAQDYVKLTEEARKHARWALPAGSRRVR